MPGTTVLGVLIALSVLPPLLFMLWVRSRERHGREPLSAVLRAFLYGGTVGVLVAVVLNVLLEMGAYPVAAGAGIARPFLAVVIVAPLVEELAKGLGLGTVRTRIQEWEDGLVYGAAIGLGFAATENLVYGLTALADEGTALAVQTVAVRLVSSTILHASSTALLGFGYGVIVLRGGIAAQLLPYYLVAVLLHAAYNFLVLGNTYLGFVVSLFMVWLTFSLLQRRIRELDRLPHAGT